MIKPYISYFVCGSQRSGSSLLCEALKNTGLGGHPEEYFLGPEEYVPNWENGAWAKANGIRTRTEYLDLVLRSGTSPNGVFGCKIMWNYFPEIRQKLAELSEYRGLHVHAVFQSLFPNLHYLWILRREKIRQAVSWAKAAQTGVYAWHAGETPVYQKQPEYDFDFIHNLHRLVIECEQGWQAYFAEIGVQPYVVYYEDLVHAYEATAIDILKYLGVTMPPELVFSECKLYRQADAINQDWVQKYQVQIRERM